MSSRAHAIRTSRAIISRPSPSIWRGSANRAVCSRMRPLPARAGVARSGGFGRCSIGASGQGARPASSLEVEAALNDVATKWTAALASAGIRPGGAPARISTPGSCPGSIPNRKLREATRTNCSKWPLYPGDENLPFGYDFAERLTLAMPRSDNDTATWWFDGLPHTLVSVQGCGEHRRSAT